MAGRPASYFRIEDEGRWAREWGLPWSPDDRGPFVDFVTAALAAGRSENSVFGVRIMWESMDQLRGDLRRSSKIGGTVGDLELLESAFGRLHFVYLQREDVVAQAVSLWRAEQTQIWHVTDPEDRKAAEREPRYDFAKIDEFVTDAVDHNEAWRAWFERVGVEPHHVVYEELAADPVATVRGVLAYLGLRLPSEHEIAATNQRLADAVNDEWAERYRSEAAD